MWQRQDETGEMFHPAACIYIEFTLLRMEKIIFVFYMEIKYNIHNDSGLYLQECKKEGYHRMKLTVKNFAKIEMANIKVDGITVIAGENNTGKSTVGKILFSLFNSLYNINLKVTVQRKREIISIATALIRNYLLHDSSMRGLPFSKLRRWAEYVAEAAFCLFENEDMDEDVLAKMLLDSLKEHKILINEKTQEFENIDATLHEIAGRMIQIIEISDEAIMLELISRYFNDVFCQQINSLKNNSNAAVELDIQKKEIKLVFSENTCKEYNAQLPILNQAFYIDNPFIIDKLTEYDELCTTEDFLVRQLIDKEDEGVVGSVIAKEKISEIIHTLTTVVQGSIIESQDGKFYLEEVGLREPVYLNNLSTGMKSFVLLRMMLEKGILKEKDILILDEPEIHLHPQWQIAYAETIVLLEKYFDLSVIVTTHSPYFLDALNIFSAKHGVENRVNYYLSEVKNGNVIMKCVNDNINLIYEKMADPIQVLDTLRYELNHQ